MSNLDFNLFDYSSNMTDTVSLTGMWEDLFCYVRYFISNFSVLFTWRNEDVQLEGLWDRDWVMQVNTDQDPSLVAT